MSALALFLLVGCQSSKEQSEPSGGKMTTATAPAPAPAVTSRILVHTEGHPH